MKILAAHQPNFLPHVGFFDKMDRADRFALMWDAQFVNREYQNRVKIGLSPGKWLTIPVHAPYECKISDVLVSDNLKIKKVVGQIEDAYRKAPYWNLYGSEICDLTERCYTPGAHLVHANTSLLCKLMHLAEIHCDVVRVGVPESKSLASPSELLAWYTSSSCCTTYLSGKGAESYLDRKAFHDRGVDVKLQEVDIHPQFRGMSMLTALMYKGTDWRDLIRESTSYHSPSRR